jgi:hypothetical protein
MWSEYRRIKHRFLFLLLGWFPFAIVMGKGLPPIIGTDVPSVVLIIAYMLFIAFMFLQYLLYPCPNCGTSYRGWQLYRRTCPHCGVEIDAAPRPTPPTALSEAASVAPEPSSMQSKALASALAGLNKRVAIAALAVLIPFVAVVVLWAWENPERARMLVQHLRD